MNLIKKLKINSTVGHERDNSCKKEEDAGQCPQPNLEMQLKCLTKEIESLHNQILSLEQDLDKQRRLKVAFKLHAGNLGNYVKVCLQALQAQGIQERMLRESIAQHDGCGHDDELRNQRVSSLKEQACQSGWYISASEIELGNEIVGSGATSDTYKGIWHGLDVAVKCIRPIFFNDEKSVHSFCQELELLSRVRHPNVVQFLGACMSIPDKAWIVMECMSSGTLTEWIHGSKKRSPTRVVPLPSLSQRLHVALGIAQGMQYLHECDPKILHRDLKPSNVFMDKNGGIRISDFGFAKLLENDIQAALTGETGTYIYMAPEVVRHEPYNDKCDVYSYGVILCELITGVPPYIGTHLTPLEIAFAVAQGKLRPSLPEETNSMLSVERSLVELVISMWDHDPSYRPSFAKVTCLLKSLMVNLDGL